MDKYGQMGPEKGDYAADVLLVAKALERGLPVSVALTHRMTRQAVVLASERGVLAFRPAARGVGEWMFVAVEERGAYWFRVDMLINAGYMAEKLGVALPDAETLSEFLARVVRVWGLEPTVGKTVVTHGIE